MKKRIVAVCCLVMLLSVLFGAEAYAQPQRFAVEIEYGFDGAAKEYGDIPITLEIRNDGEEFAGGVRVLMGAYRYGRQTVAYEADLHIGAGETKRVRIYSPYASSVYDVNVSILDAGGSAVFEKESEVFVSQGTALVGILSDNTASLSYLSQLHLLDSRYSLSTPKVVDLTKDIELLDYPTLQLLDVVVINDFRTDQLTGAQTAQLKGWVEQGGTLLLGTGVHYQKTVSGFIDDYIGGTIGRIEPKTGYLGIRGEYNIEEEDSLELDVLNINIEGAVQNPDQWCQTAYKGQGSITVFQFDLASERLADWGYRGQAMERIINDVLYNKVAGASSYRLDSGHMDSVISNVYINTIPGIWRYIIVLGAYIVLLPMLYLFLKKRDKRHFLWVAVPAMSVVFALVIYTAGTGSRLKNPNLNYLCVLAINGQTAQESVYMGSTSPRNNPYSFRVGGDYSFSNMSSYYYYGYGSSGDSGSPNITIKRAAEHEARIQNNAAFDTKYFLAERYNDSLGALDVRMEQGVGGYRFLIENHTQMALEDATISIPYTGVIQIGAIGAGESAEYTDAQIIPDTYGYGYGYGYLPIPEDADEQQISRYNQLRAVSESIGSEICLIGFTGDYRPDVGGSAGIDTAGDTMVVKLIREAGAEQRQRHYIPDIAQYLVPDEPDEVGGEDDGASEYEDPYAEPDGHQYLTYRFEDMTLECLTVSGKELSDAIALYNYDEGYYEEVFWQENPLFSLEPYLNEEQELRVRYAEYYYQMYQDDIPVISAIVLP